MSSQWLRSSAWLEHWTFNPGVGGSNPLGAIVSHRNIYIEILFILVMKREVVGCSGGLHLYKKIAKVIGAESSKLEVKKFPDGELNIRFLNSLKGKEVFLVQSFYPDCNEKIVETLIAGYTAKNLGASKVKLIAPYYPYLRQDKRFREGEAISVSIMDKITSIFNEIIVLDPHLHRIKNIKGVIKKGRRITTVDVIADYIKQTKIENPYFIGPDIESRQWDRNIAKKVGAPYLVLRKTRYSSRHVKINSKSIDLSGYSAIMIDDIISSGHTILETVKEVKKYNPKKIYVIGIHGLFCEGALEKIKKEAIVLSTNTIDNPVSKIDISSVFKVLKK